MEWLALLLLNAAWVVLYVFVSVFLSVMINFVVYCACRVSPYSFMFFKNSNFVDREVLYNLLVLCVLSLLAKYFIYTYRYNICYSPFYWSIVIIIIYFRLLVCRNIGENVSFSETVYIIQNNSIILFYWYYVIRHPM